MKSILNICFLIFLCALVACNEEVQEPEIIVQDKIQLFKMRVGSIDVLNKDATQIEIDKPIVITFSDALDQTTSPANISITDDKDDVVAVTYAFLDNNRSISLSPEEFLAENTTYTVIISEELKGAEGETFDGFKQQFQTINEALEIRSIRIDDEEISLIDQRILNISLEPTIQIKFSSFVPIEDLQGKISLNGGGTIPTTLNQVNDSTVNMIPDVPLQGYRRNRLVISSSLDVRDKSFDGFNLEFYTKIDSTLKFPELSDEDLLTKVQEQTFKYFYDFGHPNSGLTRERNTSGDVVTIGGTGFGLMAMIVGIERGFITKQQGIDRLERMINFLSNNVQRYHGVFPHWLNGITGNTIPFSGTDDGGDLVETSFLMEGLLTVRQYLDPQVAQEAELITTINRIWNEVEWNWHVQPNTKHLTWHWSPNFDFQLNLRISGWNESLITYVLAAGSTDYSIEKEVYTEGWARNGDMINGDMFYNITLPLGENRGGPLFYSHYSFLGLDPTLLSDQYADNYYEQNKAHTLINRAYCVVNPRNFVGYSSSSWGLTASDTPSGYAAHSPTNDLGTITPTAAISSIPYTPEESMEAIRFFYYIMGDKLWGEHGFYDAFNITEGWYANSYLAIDQGPILLMIENHRTGLLWDLFMSAPEAQAGLDKLGFTYQ